MAKKNKSKRNRGWPSDDPKKWNAYGAGKDRPPATVDDLIHWLKMYTTDLSEWGQDVRDDIVRLEAAIGLPPGDPGDPPAGPPD